MFQDSAFAFAPDRPLRGPSGGDVGEIEGEDELAGHRIPAVSHGIRFEETGTGLIPLVGFNRDLLLKALAGVGRREAFALNAQPRVGEQAVDGRRGYFGHSRLHPRGEGPEGLRLGVKPNIQEGCKALGAGGVGGEPATVQYGPDLRLVVA